MVRSPNQEVFGQACSAYRVPQIRTILSRAGINYMSRDTKHQLLSKLIEFELTADVYTTDAITSFVLNGNELPDFTNLLRECTVCMESFPQNNFSQRRITSNCQHAPDLCLQCLNTSITIQLDERPWNQLSCPLCPEILSFGDVQEFATKETFDRYVYLTLWFD